MSEDNSTDIDEFQSSNNEESKITVTKSSYNKMLKGIVVAIAIATFLGGYAVGTLGGTDSLSADEIKDIMSEIEANTPSPQPAQAPSQPSTPSVIQVSLDDDPFKGNANAPKVPRTSFTRLSSFNFWIVDSSEPKSQLSNT